MAVTINSNGTITGIAAGGLPDGVVDADTLADNAVTTAKINADAVTAAKVADDVVNSEHLVDGGVDNAHLATGIASSKLSGALPAISGAALTGISGGKVLQHKVATSSNPQTYNNSMTTTTELISTTFTPTASNSTILINMHWKATHQDSSDGYWFGGLYRGSTQIYIFGEAVSGYVDMHVGQYPSFWHMDSPATTSQLTYKMMPYYGVSFTSSNFYITRMRMVLLELAPN